MSSKNPKIVPLVKESPEVSNPSIGVSGKFYTMKRANSAWVMVKIIVEDNRVVSETVSDHDLMTIIEAKIVREIHKGNV